jgi:hypothetical protein
MSDAQEPAPNNSPDNPSDGVLAEPERAKLQDDLLEMRRTIIDSKASRMALIVGVLTFLLLGKLGLTLAMVLGLVAGAIVYAAKKAAQGRKMLSPIANYNDERLRHWHTQAVLELVAAQKRSAIIRGTLMFVGVVLVIIWIVARVQR